MHCKVFYARCPSCWNPAYFRTGLEKANLLVYTRRLITMTVLHYSSLPETGTAKGHEIWNTDE